MKKTLKIYAFVLVVVILGALYFRFADAQSIPTLDQWVGTSSPATAITQRTSGKALKLTGLSDGCLSVTAGLVQSSGSSCGGSALTATTPLSIVANVLSLGIVPISLGGTATSAAPAYGQVLLGNGLGGYSLVSTSTLGIVSGGTPGGSSQDIQFNNSGSFGGSDTLQWDGSHLLVNNVSGNILSIYNDGDPHIENSTGNTLWINQNTGRTDISSALSIEHAGAVTIEAGDLHVVTPNAVFTDTIRGETAGGAGLSIQDDQGNTQILMSNAGGLYIGQYSPPIFPSVNGNLPLHVDINNILISASIDLANTMTTDVAGILPVGFGGTGTDTPPMLGQLLIGNGTGGYDYVASSTFGGSGGSGTPAGSDTQVQFNNMGAFAADPNFTWNYDDKALHLGSVGADPFNGTIVSPNTLLFVSTSTSSPLLSLSESNIFLGYDGAADETSDGGNLTVSASAGGSTSGAGGSLMVQAGSAQAGDSNGGTLTIGSGTASGAGTQGNMNLQAAGVLFLKADSSGVTAGAGYPILLSDSDSHSAASLSTFLLSTQRDFQFPDASGVLALQSDLANYVPTSRTITTTSPLLGGGSLSSDLTLSLGTVPIANGGTGTSTAPTTGKVLVGNSTGGYDYVSSSTFNGVGFGYPGQMALYAATGTSVVGSSSVFVLPNGNIQIGTSTSNLLGGATVPGNTLQVIANTGQLGTLISVSSSGGSFAGYGYAGSINSPTQSATDTILGIFTGRGYGLTGFSAGSKGAFAVKAQQTWTDAAQGTYVDFETTGLNSTTRTEKARITSAGFLGIGTTSPQNMLDLSAAGTSFSTAPVMRFTDTSASGHKYAIGARSDAFTAGSFILSDETAGSIRVFVDSSGNVGIGTSTTLTPLSVAGQGKFVGLTSASGDVRLISNDFNSDFSVRAVQSTANKFDIRDNKNSRSPFQIAGANDGTMFLGGNGTVGINSTAPGNSFYVKNAFGAAFPSFGEPLFNLGARAAYNILTTNENAITGSSTGIGFMVNANADNVGGSIVFVKTNTNSQGELRLYTKQNTTSGGTLTEGAVLSDSGKFGIATGTPWRTLSVVGTMAVNGLTSATGKNAVCIDSATKEFVDAGNNTCVLSSKYVKHDISSITSEQAAKIMELNPIKYTENEDNTQHYGFIAEEIEQVDPLLAAHANEDITVGGHQFKTGDPIGVDYLRAWALLTKFVQGQQKQIEAVSSAGRSQAEENWQWLALLALAGIVGFQQYQIRKLTKNQNHAQH